MRDVEIMGPVSAELHVRSSLRYTDFFVRLCDVEPSGKSINICDGLARLGPADWHSGTEGVAAASVSLWPAAHVFRRGHRIRVQVSSGAHPRFARNLGGGEPLGTAATIHVADQQVWHSAAHPSAIVLPVRDPA
jgi:putative CocE/NonD family hydrolase